MGPGFGLGSNFGALGGLGLGGPSPGAAARRGDFNKCKVGISSGRSSSMCLPTVIEVLDPGPRAALLESPRELKVGRS